MTGGGLAADEEVFNANGHAEYAEGVGTLRADGGDCGPGSENLVTGTLAASGAGSERPAGQANETDMLVLEEAHTLRAEGFDASEDGTGRGTPIVPVALRNSGRDSDMREGRAGSTTADDEMFALQAEQQHSVVAFMSTDSGMDAGEEISPTLRRGNDNGRENRGGARMAVAFSGGNSSGARSVGAHEEETPPLRSADSGTNRTPSVAQHAAVRRLTPTECERLQGFPDGFTAIQWRGKIAADGPRYRALGNAMTTNVVEYIGRRIALVEELLRDG